VTPVPTRRPLVIAHRGASGYELENSIAAFRAAAARGADAVELDVYAAADGTLVVHHDPALEGDRPIAGLTGRDIRNTRLANGEPVPTLDDALAAVDARLAVFVEVKALPSRDDAALLDALARGPNPGGYAVHSFDHRIIRRLGQQRPDLARGVLQASYPLHPLAALADAGAGTLWQDAALADAGLADAVRAAGALMIVWTVNRDDEMHRVVRLGVHGLATNYPDTARHIVDEWPA
jgi:glycerophosphoryl diester phosphodiesterase